MPEERKIWIARSGKRHGPYPESSILAFYKEGRIFGDDLAWYSELEDWLPLQEIVNLDASEETTSIIVPQAEPTPPLSSKLHCNLMTDTNTAAYVHKDAKRKNNPPAKIAGEGKIPKVGKVRYYYNPHLDPVLRFDSTGKSDRLNEIIEKAKIEALTPEEAEILSKALSGHQPWLEWAEKREHEADRGWFEVDPVALHIHERVSAQAIVSSLRRGDYQRLLFADPELEYKEAVKFYEHDVDWANRLILGDSLQVMSSLARREDMAGKVQMIYMDPPYGIKFAGNFQNEINKRDVKEKDSDLTREPEMIKAYRDTWELGTHSYLSYLKERLIVARELLTETGSIFLQISDANLHRVRLIMDEVFGVENFVSLITYRTKNMTFGSKYLESVCDYIVWYSLKPKELKYNQLYRATTVEGDSHWNLKLKESGGYEIMSKTEIHNHNLLSDDISDVCQLGSLYPAGLNKSGVFPLDIFGKHYYPPNGKSWKTNEVGMKRVAKAERILPYTGGQTIRYLLKQNDYPVSTVAALWNDSAPPAGKVYVVQTNHTVIQKCILMKQILESYCSIKKI